MLLYVYSFFILLFVFLLFQSTDLVLSALLLAVCFFTTAFLLASWGFDYIAITYQVVYLGAVIVLFLFVVMFLDTPRLRGGAGFADAGGALAPVGSLLAPLLLWLLASVPLLWSVYQHLWAFLGNVVLTDPYYFLAPEPGSTDFGSRGVGVDDAVLPFMSYFFVDGWLVLVLFGLLFLVALIFSLFLIFCYAL